MRILQLIMLILISTIRIHSQVVDTDPLKIIKSQVDSVYNVSIIPDNALTGEFDLLITGQENDLCKKVNTNLIEISWLSMYIDGRYVLVITPRQIYFKSGHDNPNPNHLYWLTRITVTQFVLIRNFLEAKRSSIFHDYTSGNSTNLTYYFDKAKIERYKVDFWTNRRYDNFQSLLKLINQPLSKIGEPVLIPSKEDFEKIRNLRLVIDIFELQDQIKMIRIE